MPVAAPALQPSASPSKTNGLNPLRTIVERRVAQWKEPGKTPTERRKRRMSLHCGLFNALAAVIELLAQGREFVSLLLDYSEGREKIDVFDEELVEYLTIKEHLSKDTAKKRIYRGRTALNQAQNPQKGNTIIAVIPGDKIRHPDGHEEKISCSYDLTNVWGVLSLAQSIAQPELKLTTNRPRLLQAAITVALDEFPWMAPLRTHKPKRPPSNAEKLEHDKVLFMNAARRIFEKSDGSEEKRKAEMYALLERALAEPVTFDDAAQVLPVRHDHVKKGDKSAAAGMPPARPLLEKMMNPPEVKTDELLVQADENGGGQDRLSLAVLEDKELNPGLVSQPPNPAPSPEAAKPTPPAPPQTIGMTKDEFLAEHARSFAQYKTSKVDEWFSLAELENFDPRAGGRNKKERRFCCPNCHGSRRFDVAHRSLSLNTVTGAYHCKRCNVSGKLRDYCTDEAARALPARQFSTSASSATERERDERWRIWFERAAPITNTPGAAYLLGRGIPTDVAARAGVKFTDFGKPSVLFPVRNDHRKLVAIQARRIRSTDTPKAKSKGSISEGVFAATPNALEARRLAVCEAPIDALALAACGLAAIALCGVSNWPEWLSEALAGCEVMIAFDADEPGDRLAQERINQLSGSAIVFRLRPGGRKDWAEIAERDGLDSLREQLATILGETEPGASPAENWADSE